MITVSASREPVTVQLEGALATVGLTLRRMTSADFASAGTATLAILNDAERLEAVMAANGLMPEGGPSRWRSMASTDPVEYGAAVTGAGVWLGAVECAVRAIINWTGILTEDGNPAPVSRAVVESLMLNEAFAEQTQAAIDKAAALIVPVPTMGVPND